MPLWEANWWPKAALNCGSCCLGCVEVRRSCAEDGSEDEGAGEVVKPVEPHWGIAESAATGCSVTECVVAGGVDREVDMR